MLELASSQLLELCTRHKRKDNVRGKPLLEEGLHAQGVCCVDQNACVLGRDDRLNHGGNIINIGERLDTEEDIVKWCFGKARCLLR